MFWTMLYYQYVKPELNKFEEVLVRVVRRISSKCVAPFSRKYPPWLEESPELKVYGAQRFQDIIGQICWAVYIGSFDIVLETSLMSSYLFMPRIGNIDQDLTIL